MNIIEAINRLKNDNCKCDLCSRQITKEQDLVLDTQGKKSLIICTQCHKIRRGFADEGLPLL